ncbi:MAG: hypothetical protein WC858_03825 [Parcubacteria group bacterium]|jgi:hypothetical protein
MGNKDGDKKSILGIVRKKAANSGKFLLRWLYLFVLVGIAAYSAMIWYYNIYQGDWSEEQKKEYINEQSKFSFDKKSFDKITDLVENKKQYFSAPANFEGKDVFYPDGF